MPRKPTVRTDQFPYHITARCNNCDWYQIPLNFVWEIYSGVFEAEKRESGIEPLAFVLMGNHFHCLLRTPNANIDSAMRNIMRKSSLAIGKAAGRINRIYGGRYKSTLVANDRYLLSVMRYIFQNPLRAGICAKVEDYPYSTALDPRDFPVTSLDLELSKEKFVEYLNEDVQEESKLLCSALKRRELRQLKSRTSRRGLVLDATAKPKG
jgi:putative transposase